jgi:hypothetical protein
LLANLYRVPPGAEHLRPIWVRDRISTSSAAVTVNADWTNGQQLPLLLLNCGIETTAGAAQTVSAVSLSLVDPDSSFASPIGGERSALATAAVTLAFGFNFGPGLVVPPRWRLRAVGLFNAGANANVVRINPLGFFISRGNLGLP